MTDDPRTLVSTAWLAERLGRPGLVVLDASWHLPGSGRDAGAEFEHAHVPGARRFDIDAVADVDSPLPHTAPSPIAFHRATERLLIEPGTQVVAYDAHGLFSAARAWWTFRLMGHEAVAVLDGGLPAWLAEGRPVEAGPERPFLGFGPEGGPRFDLVGAPWPEPARLADADAVAQALATGAAQVVDARSAPRFRGESPEPRPGVRPGHIPGSLNLPFREVLDERGRMKDADGLRAALAANGVDPQRPVIATCGSGVTAAILALALERLGRTAALYDGSWAEWGAENDSGRARPVATGAP